jgi:hypothetical protein
MACGVTSTTLLPAVGTSPAAARVPPAGHRRTRCRAQAAGRCPGGDGGTEGVNTKTKPTARQM